MVRKYFLILAILFATMPLAAAAQNDQPVVFGVLFYSPECPHCHAFIENDWPGMQAEFGDQFQLLFINVQTQGGEALFRAAYNAPQLHLDSLGVPTMVIGDQVMVGSVDIPQQAPILVREGLAQGGIGLPAIPGLSEAYEASQAQATSSGTDTQGNTATTASGVAESDPVAEAVAIGVLALLTVSLVAALAVGMGWLQRGFGWYAALFTAVLGIGAGLTLAAEAITIPLVFLLAALEIVALGAVVLGLWMHHTPAKQEAEAWPGWLLPIASAGGLAVAVYLAYVELTQVEAICGLVGECNVVQQSEYARLFGVLPVALLGILGYLTMLLFWAISYRRTTRFAAIARVILLAVSGVGVAFSIYLTFLEIFIIGAICMWCITSALVMALLLWLSAGTGREAVMQLRRQTSA